MRGLLLGAALFAVLGIALGNVAKMFTHTPRFQVGDVVEFKGLGTRAIVRDTECLPFKACTYHLMLSNGVAVDGAPGVVLEPAGETPPVVWNPLWSQNPHGIGDRPGDPRRLTREEQIAVLESQLQDPYRHPLFDSELRREIARLKRGKS